MGTCSKQRMPAVQVKKHKIKTKVAFCTIQQQAQSVAHTQLIPKTEDVKLIENIRQTVIRCSLSPIEQQNISPQTIIQIINANSKGISINFARPVKIVNFYNKEILHVHRLKNPDGTLQVSTRPINTQMQDNEIYQQWTLIPWNDGFHIFNMFFKVYLASSLRQVEKIGFLIVGCQLKNQLYEKQWKIEGKIQMNTVARFKSKSNRMLSLGHYKAKIETQQQVICSQSDEFYSLWEIIQS